MMRADFIMAVIAITKHPNAALRTTETARASGMFPHPKRQVHASILADIMTLNFCIVSTTLASVLTTTRQTANATGIGVQIYQVQVAQLSEDFTEETSLDNSVMYMHAYLMILTAATG